MAPKRKERVPASQIQQGVQDVIERGVSVRAMAASLQMSKSHLQRIVNKAKETGAQDFQYCPNIGNRKIFSRAEEENLEQYLKILFKICRGLTSTQIREYAFKYADNLGVAPETWSKEQKATRTWLKVFVKRHQGLTVRRPENVSSARLTAFNKVNVGIFYDHLEDCYASHQFPAHRVWNFGETDCNTVPEAPEEPEAEVRRVGGADLEDRGNIKNLAWRSVPVTMLGVVNAAGDSIPPVFIFPRVSFSANMLANGPANALGLANPTGWMTEDAFLESLKHFVKFARPKVDEKHLVVLDYHKSHVAFSAVQYAYEHNIVLLTVPSHCSSQLQPLNRTVFGPFKTFYEESVHEWMRKKSGEMATIYQVAEFAKDAFLKTFIPENITSGFRNTGIHPFNRDIFRDEDFSLLPATEKLEASQVEAKEHSLPFQEDDREPSISNEVSEITLSSKSDDQVPQVSRKVALLPLLASSRLIPPSLKALP